MPPTAQLIRQGQFAAGLLATGTFDHYTLLRLDTADSATLKVFIEGDGRPWDDEGSTPRTDPTPVNPLALRLAAQTDGSVLYLGRPCYFDAITDMRCTPALWTSARYSEPVVASMAQALNELVREHGFRRVILFGYSGGGTLAALIAPRTPSAVAVVTIAAVLDTESWTASHGYDALSGSLNPANEPTLSAGLVQKHLVGMLDQNVSPSLNARYFQRVDPADIWRYATFTHTCCWVDEWPAILRRLEQDIDDQRGPLSSKLATGG